MAPARAETGLPASPMLFLVAGQFIWTGFDYLGEPFPYDAEWPARSSYFGCADLVGLKKDLFYLVQSQWRKDGPPMVHIVPHHWNWDHGQVLDIHVFSNCDECELFLNGRSLGRRSLEQGSGFLPARFRFIWHDIAWEPGELRVIGFRKEQPCAEETIRTAGKPSRLLLTSDRTRCAADGEDMLFVTVSATDADGTLCPDAAPFVSFSVEGSSLRIAAADAGNACSTEPFHLPECTLFSGMAVVYLQSSGEPGRSILRASAPGLEPASILLDAQFLQKNT